MPKKKKPAVSLRKIAIGLLLVDPDNMDRAMRAVVDGFRSRTPDAPVNVTTLDGGLYLIDGHHRIATILLERDADDDVMETEVQALVTAITGIEQWPFGLSEEMAPENWISLVEWVRES